MYKSNYMTVERYTHDLNKTYSTYPCVLTRSIVNYNNCVCIDCNIDNAIYRYSIE